MGAGNPPPDPHALWFFFRSDAVQRRGPSGASATAPVGDAVHLLGVREDVPDILRSLDVVVLPSDSEGSPIALIEAMVAGRAIVASRVGGMPWILDDGACGVLVPPRSPVGRRPASVSSGAPFSSTASWINSRSRSNSGRRTADRCGRA